MKRTKKGFTLVELLVVIAIIAIIAAVAVPVTISQIDKAKASTAKSEAENAVSALQTAITDLKADTTVTKIDGDAVAGALNKSFVGIKQIDHITVAYASPTSTISVFTTHGGNEVATTTASIAVEIPKGTYTWGGSTWTFAA